VGKSIGAAPPLPAPHPAADADAAAAGSTELGTLVAAAAP